MIAGSPLIVVVNKDNPAEDSEGVSRRGEDQRKAADLFVIGRRQLRPSVRRKSSASRRREVRHVPYKGASQGLTDLAGGHIAFSVQTVSSAAALVRGGTLRALAHTGKTRLPDFPDGTDVQGARLRHGSRCCGLDLGARRVAQGHRPEGQRRHQPGVQTPEVAARLRHDGLIADPMSVEEFSTFIDAETVDLEAGAGARRIDWEVNRIFRRRINEPDWCRDRGGCRCSGVPRFGARRRRRLAVPAGAHHQSVPGAGATDTLARILADHFAVVFKQSFFVEARGGAGGQIALKSVADSPQDAYTLIITTVSLLAVQTDGQPETRFRSAPRRHKHRLHRRHTTGFLRQPVARRDTVDEFMAYAPQQHKAADLFVLSASARWATSSPSRSRKSSAQV